MKKFYSLAAALAIGFGVSVAVAQVIPVPQVTTVNSNDLIQDIVRGVPSAQNQYVSAAALAAWMSSQPGSTGDFNNALVGGDATTNLFQRGTTGASQTTTVAYGGPDRWAYWSGASTAMTVSRTSAATDIPTTSYKYAFKMARTAAQAGLVQMCMAQEIETANSYAYQSTTAELDFHAIAGATYSGGNLQVYIITGTGVDEGMTNLAFGLNAGGGGSSGWTGQANAIAGTVAIGTNVANAANRYSAVAQIPAGATEIAVAICYTPTGTAGANDYVAVSGIQLVRNNGLAQYAGQVNLSSNVQGSAYSRRPQEVETALQQRYYYQITETATVSNIASCWASSTTVAQCFIPFPVTMRQAPVFTGDGGFTAGFAVPTTVAGGTLGNCSALAVSTNIASTAASISGALIACTATTVPAAGSASMLYTNSGSGKIRASAEL